ncbi:MAG: ECF transporter S component [Oscillospiraceae bacterium]|jgi:uncharacterized membrane protein|nr:ECF transporter S component [Oscillospiraceae bacterium]
MAIAKKSVLTTGYVVRLAALCTVLLIMTFTPLGYLSVGALSMSLCVIPVAIGAIVLGALGGTLLGALFGISSFIQALMGRDFGPILLEVSPLLTAFACIIPRVLEGLLTSLIFKAMRKNRYSRPFSFETAALCTALLNALLFIGALCLLFWNEYIVPMVATPENGLTATDYLPVISAVLSLVLLQAIIETLLCTVIGGAIAKALTIKKRL